MKKALAMTLAISTAASSLLVANAVPETPETGELSLPKTAPYLDEATGIEFPRELAGFIKTQVVKNANPYYGTVVRYAADDGSCADVYIYSIGKTPDEKLLDAHFQGVLKVISRLPGGNGPVRALAFKSQTTVKLGAKEGIEAKKARFSFDATSGGTFDSELVLFAFKDRILKIRVSRPVEAKTAPGAFEEDIARLCEISAEKPQAISPDSKTDSQPGH